LAYLLIGLAPMALAVHGVRESHLISATSMTHVDGASYRASISPSPFAPVLVAASDDPNHPQRSSSRLFEGGRGLGPAHAARIGVATVGKGRFSHWTTAVYFSASDNSDPRTNGRVYRLETVARLPMIVTVAWMLTFVLAAAVAMRFWSAGEPSRDWWLHSLPPPLLAASLVAVAVISIAGPGTARVWALAIWLVVGFVAAFFSGVVLRRVSTGGFLRAVAEENSALVATLSSVGVIVTSWEQRIFDAPGWRGFTARLGCLAGLVGIFVATLMTAWPEWVLAQAYGGGGRVILAAATALWLAHSRRGWLAISLGLAVTLWLFGLALAALWQDVAIHFNALGGLLPFSDAEGYFFDSSRLLDGQPLGWSARRPLFPAFFAVLLAVTGSLYVALAVMVALNAIATFLLAREVSRNFGSAAATVATLILFTFFRTDGGNGVVLTENLGFLLGATAFTALLRGVRLQDIRSYASGAVLLTAALMARAGTFFVLPALVAIGLISLRPVDRERRLNIRSALVATCAIAITATTCVVWGRTLSNAAAGKASFSNYSYVLYGLVVGGKGWGQVNIDHPDAHEGAEIYRLAYQAFRDRPGDLVLGMARMVRAYLWPSEPYHMFAFIQDGPRTRWLQRACYMLVLIGLGACAWKWRDPVHALVLAAAAGHFASIPFVPPIDAGLRVYAATMPALAVLVATGVAVPGNLFTNFRRRHAKDPGVPPSADVTSRLSESAALLLLTVIMGASWTLYVAGEPPTSLHRPMCPNGSESLVVRADHDAVVRIKDDRAPRAISPTEVRQSELHRTVGVVELKGESPNIRAGMSLRFSYDPMDGQQLWLVGESRRLETPSGLLQICGHYTKDETARRYGLMFVDEAWAAELPRSR
jgi:hypothetical protein